MSSEQAPQSDSKGATQKDALFFFHILNNMKNTPEVDWEVVADLAGYNNAGTARTRFGQIKKKLSALSGTPSNTPKAPRSSTKQKGGELGSGSNITPTKVTKKRGKKTKVEVKEDSDTDDALATIMGNETEDEKLEA
ncbi:uncharacterized protein BP5553_08370 [Venustampulla echinocandica]|uniref:Myb-like DNA-binding domain-containing protein n=1 Tax=Venustampulla echinocandica TaxID=2656787 RepID=A0A370TGH3_9HELO|nr:uncharacterized protein BP5553_08370 [Venustampulla echinocandica]RDL34002.1 hypothetical protein BP5553_08370 [Venustampulla echinocandica]